MVRFLFASALPNARNAERLRRLETLLADHPRFRECHVALIAAELREKRVRQAGERLAAFLLEFAPPEDDRFRALADLVCRQAGAPGWMGVRSDGLALVSLARTEACEVAVLLDGAAVGHWRAPSGAAPIRRPLPRSWVRADSVGMRVDAGTLFGSGVSVARRRAVEGFVDRADDGAVRGWAWHPADPERPPRLQVVVSDARGTPVATARIVAAEDWPHDADAGEFSRRRGFTVPARLALARTGAARIAAAAETVAVTAGDGRHLGGSPVAAGAAGHEDGAAIARTIAARHALTGYALTGRALSGHALSGRALSGRAPPGRRRGADAGDPVAPLRVASLSGVTGAARPWAAPDPAAGPDLPPVDIVIPVFRGAGDFEQCLQSLDDLPERARIVVVDDGSPDPQLRAAVARAERAGRVVVLRHEANRGFPAAANTGLRHAAAGRGRDVVLLNPDTILAPGAIRRLARVAYSAGDVGSVTPMTNDGTIASYDAGRPADTGKPGDTKTPGDPCTRAGVEKLDGLFQAANGDGKVEVPTAVGFCMFIRRDCLRTVGGFRDEVFAPGYGEENDWSLRARHLGWRHVVATGIFVAHSGGRSFGALKADLVARNLRRLNELHPGYDAEIRRFQAADPLAKARRGVDRLRWRAQRSGHGAVVLVTHHLGGGVTRHVRERCEAARAEGLRPIVLRPAGDKVAVEAGDGTGHRDLAFDPVAERGDLLRLLRRERPRRVELHHFIGHRADIVAVVRSLGVPVEMFVHDSSLWCPRVSLVTGTGKYCGEPAQVAECEACVADFGNRIHDDIAVADLRARSRDWLAAADRVVVPCGDAARRIGRQFPGIGSVVEPWEDDAARAGCVRPPRERVPGRRRRIVVLGAIGTDKGFDVLLACARDAAHRDLPIEFVLVGHSLDDQRLFDTGRVFVTGRFREGEGASLAAEQDGDLGFIPSVWPETWCYALSTLWSSGLRVVAFDLGAQAERIRATGAGAVLPLGLPTSRINSFLVDAATGEAGIPGRRPPAS